MPSLAFDVHLELVLADAVALIDAHGPLRSGGARRADLVFLNRAAVVLSVSAWESYVEELMRESLAALRPPGPVLGAWPALSAYVLGQVGRFHTPSAPQVEQLVRSCLSLPDVHLSWHWSGCTSAQAVQALATALNYRHEIAHGTYPRPMVTNAYALELPDFFRRLARRTDRAVRAHLIQSHGLTSPWPA